MRGRAGAHDSAVGVLVHDGLLDDHLERDLVVLDPLRSEQLVEGQAEDALGLRLQVGPDDAAACRPGVVLMGDVTFSCSHAVQWRLWGRRAIANTIACLY